jgi:hypothetical protein
LPSGITSIGTYAFYQCTNLALTSLPSGITTIENYTFYQCTNLALTSLPSGITTIGNYAFYECSGVKLTSLPSGITSISQHAFYKCIGIANISIPATVSYLGVRSLYCCVVVSSTGNDVNSVNIRMLGTTPPEMEAESYYADSGAFGRNNFFRGTITVPKECGEIYKSANVWSNYAGHIVEES